MVRTLGTIQNNRKNRIYFTTHTIVQWLHVFGYVIMLNHFHLIAQTEIGVRFQDVMRDMKKYTSKAIAKELEKDIRKLLLCVLKMAAEEEKGKRNYKIWQNDYHPKILYTDKVCRQKLAYMHHNPVRKGFVSNAEEWLYSSARNYLLDDNSIIEIEKLEMI